MKPTASNESHSSSAVIASGIVLPLALAQFIASFAATNMNVAINSIASQLHTNVAGVQTVITLFTLVMAALMIPGSKVTDLWGIKFCLLLGLVVYGAGAIISSLAHSLLVLTIGYSFLEGIGSALLIPPIYILVTLAFTNIASRAKNFGIISAAGGIGAATGPLIGGLIVFAVSWRASFIFQALVVAVIFVLSLKIQGRQSQQIKKAFDIGGTLLSALSLVLIVGGFLISRTYGWFKSRESFLLFGVQIIPKGGLSPVWILLAIGLIFMLWFMAHIKRREKAHKSSLISTKILKNHISNLGLITQIAQWLIMQGSFFVASVFLQTIRGLSAIETGLVLTPATAGILATSMSASRLAKKYNQTWLIRAGFAICTLGLLLIILLVRSDSSVLTFIPGLLIMGAGIGIMLTSSVNVVQSSFSAKEQGEISGLSRSVSNLGSSFGTALAGSLLVSSLVKGNAHFLLAMGAMAVVSVLGFITAQRFPKTKMSSPKMSQETFNS